MLKKKLKLADRKKNLAQRKIQRQISHFIVVDFIWDSHMEFLCKINNV